MPVSLLDKRFIIVAGKGGVGKSTVCASLGLMAARAGKRTIIAELNTNEKASALFGKPPSGYTHQEIHPNLYSINIQPEPALREYGLMKLRFERVFKLVFENDAMRRLLRMIPGMNELILLGKAFNLERERTRAGTPTWDLVIVDAPATGHGVSLLRVPQVILEVAKSGPMADEVRDMRRLLIDGSRTVLNLVSLPEEMPVRETRELAAQVDTVLNIPTGYLFINAVYPTLLPPDARAVSDRLRAAVPTDDTRAAGAMRCLSTIMQRRDLQEHYIKELRQHVPLPAVEIPFLFEREFGFDAIDGISRHLTQQLALHAAPPQEAHGR